MDIVQDFYDGMAAAYDKLFYDWQASTREQAAVLDALFRANGMERTACVLDCACGIGTQAIGLAELGYDVTASDISRAELEQARVRAVERGVELHLARADFRMLEDVFSGKFGIVMAMDNALPHMLTRDDLCAALASMVGRLEDGGLLVASIRDYDALLRDKPAYSPPYIHKTEAGQRVSFQTWEWDGDRYRLIQYILDDGEHLQAERFVCEYRAVRREEMTDILRACGCSRVRWCFPEETGYYQPIVVAEK